MVEVQKLEVFARFKVPARCSAGIGVVEVQKLEVLCDFYSSRATLCGDRRGRGAKNLRFLRFLKFPRDPLRGSAWSRSKDSRFFAISKVPARPSAGIGVVEVQKLELILRFLRCSRNPLRESAWSRCKNSRFFCVFCCSNWSSGVVSWFARLLPGPAGRGFDSSLVRGRASQDATCKSNLRSATCADQLAPTSLHRAPCLEQLAQSNLRRATCTEQLAQSSLRRATCREQLARSNLHRATCREPLAGTNLHGATCAEQLAQSNLHSATCVEQLAQTNLHRPVCAEHLAWCCLALASRMLRVGKKNASCSVGPTSLVMLCFRGLVTRPCALAFSSQWEVLL